MMKTAYRFLFVSALLISSTTMPPRPPAQEIILQLTYGTDGPDWLTNSYPLFLGPGQLIWWMRIRLNSGAGSALRGPKEFSWECCTDAATGMPVTPRGLYVWVLPSPACQWFPPLGSGYASRIYCPPALSPLIVPDTGNAEPANLIVQTASFATPGEYIARLRVESPTGVGVHLVYITVVPRTWPADGPNLRCAATATISLATRDLFAWKARNPLIKSYNTGVSFSSNLYAGLYFRVTGPPNPWPLVRNVATINFTNTKGWPVGIRAIDGRTCRSGQQFTVAEGKTVTFTINRADTTTLVFSKSSCRAWPPWFDCWGRSGLGLDDIASFSQGPFWTLFGGRIVNLETYGDWGSLPTPDSTAVIRTGP